MIEIFFLDILLIFLGVFVIGIPTKDNNDKRLLFGGVSIIAISLIILVLSLSYCVYNDTIKITVTEKYDTIGNYDTIIDDDLGNSYFIESKVADKMVINNTYNVNVKYYTESDIDVITGIVGDYTDMDHKCNKCK